MAEIHASRRLQIQPQQVVELARKLRPWNGLRLDEERDRRLRLSATGNVSRSAYRGQITRRLIDELRETMQGPKRPPALREGAASEILDGGEQ